MRQGSMIQVRQFSRNSTASFRCPNGVKSLSTRHLAPGHQYPEASKESVKKKGPLGPFLSVKLREIEISTVSLPRTYGPTKLMKKRKFQDQCTSGNQLLWSSINWLLGRSTDVFYSKKQPSKAQYKKKVVLRSSKNIRTNHYHPCRNIYLTSISNRYG